MLIFGPGFWRGAAGSVRRRDAQRVRVLSRSRSRTVVSELLFVLFIFFLGVSYCVCFFFVVIYYYLGLGKEGFAKVWRIRNGFDDDLGFIFSILLLKKIG